MERFDSSNLNDEQREILAMFFHRRLLFDAHLAKRNISLFTCPGCGYPTLIERGAYEICSICNWEDDYQDGKEADEIWGGPNSSLSLTENRLIIGSELNEAIKKYGQSLNDNPAEVLAILSHYDTTVHKILAEIPEDATTNDLLFRHYQQAGYTLLQQLVK